MLKKLFLEINVNDPLLNDEKLLDQIKNFLRLRGQPDCKISLDDNDADAEEIIHVNGFVFKLRASQGNTDFVTRCITLIVDHLEEVDFNLLKFSELLNVSKPTFYRKIKATTGLSARDFILQIKMQVAYQLLQTGKYSVSEVAWRCGYQSVRYFSKKFFDRFKQYPSKIFLPLTVS